MIKTPEVPVTMPSHNPLCKGEKRQPPPSPQYLFIRKNPSRGPQKQILYLSHQPQLCHITMLSQSLAKEKALLFQVLRIFLSRIWDRTTFSENMGYQFLKRGQLLISRNKELMAIEQGICSICHTSQCASIAFTMVPVCFRSM